MPLASPIPRPDGDTFLLLRKSYVTICQGNTTAALLLSYFEHWHLHRLEQVEKARQENDTAARAKEPRSASETLMQFHTMQNLEDALMGSAKRHAIENARKVLVDLGIITLHKNPNPRYSFDSTVFYLFHPARVAELVVGGRCTPPPPQVAEISNRDVEINKTSTYNTFIELEEKKTTALASEVGPASTPEKVKKEAPPKPPPKKPDPPLRVHWQAMVDTWFAVYKEHNKGEEPNFTGRNPAFFGQLYDYLERRARRVKHEEFTEQYAVESLRFFLSMALADPWLQDHLLLENLVSQADTLYARAARSTAPAVQAPKGASKEIDEIKYLLQRFAETSGDIDRRLLTDLYDKLLSKGRIKLGTMSQFKGETPDEQKANAAESWIRLTLQNSTR